MEDGRRKEMETEQADGEVEKSEEGRQERGCKEQRKQGLILKERLYLLLL